MSQKLIGGEEIYFSTKESACGFFCFSFVFFFPNGFVCSKLHIIHEAMKKF